MTLLGPVLLTLALSGRQFSSSGGYVQSATAGCKIAEERSWEPLRLFERVARGDTLLAPAKGSLVVVFRESGMRYRLIGPGQARVSAVDLTALRGAKVQRLGRLDLRLTSDASRDRRYGRAIGGVLAQAGPWEEEKPLSNAPLPTTPALEAPATTLPLATIPSLVRPLTPVGIVRISPRRIVLTPAPLDATVTVETNSPERDKPRTFRLPMRKGVIEVPADLFGEDFVDYRVLDGKKLLAEGETRVMNAAQLVELARSERLARASSDKGDLLALASLYDDLKMIEDEDRILRELLARHPDDEILHEAIESLRRTYGVREGSGTAR